MPDYRSRPLAGGQPAAEMIRNAVARIPTVYGRLNYLAELRDPQSGRYTHPSLSEALGAEETDWTLRYSHYQVFSRWLNFSLAEQKSDLDEFLSQPNGQARALRYRELVPASAREVERQLFITDLETLLELLRVERNEAWLDQEP